jgi:hypothetical protein
MSEVVNLLEAKRECGRRSAEGQLNTRNREVDTLLKYWGQEEELAETGSGFYATMWVPGAQGCRGSQEAKVTCACRPIVFTLLSPSSVSTR